MHGTEVAVIYRYKMEVEVTWVVVSYNNKEVVVICSSST